MKYQDVLAMVSIGVFVAVVAWAVTHVQGLYAECEAKGGGYIKGSCVEVLK